MQERQLRVPEVRIDLVGVLLDAAAGDRIDHVPGVG
jgi:hypothetical protein